ncbi:MAG TPA: hypothetical protein VFE47_22515 [Tepidisphaeraceae bacterium]|jgi:hypothetical protein|nr:hypothetical protein [Tepidisphaeraceae bacterium]
MGFRIGERVALTESLTCAGTLVPAGTIGIVKAGPAGGVYDVEFRHHPHSIPVRESSLVAYKGLEGKSGTNSGGKPPAFHRPDGRDDFAGLEGETGTNSGGRPPKDSGSESENF